MSYPIYTQTHPTLAQLKARRLECLTFALAMYRRASRAHPLNSSRIDWEHACRYWTEQAYHAHGEILARRGAIKRISESAGLERWELMRETYG